MLVVLTLFVHIVQVIMILKLIGFDLFQNISKGLFIFLFIAFCVVTWFIIKETFPLKKISQIDVAPNDIKKYNARLIFYSLFSILMLIVLLIFLKYQMGI